VRFFFVRSISGVSMNGFVLRLLEMKNIKKRWAAMKCSINKTNKQQSKGSCLRIKRNKIENNGNVNGHRIFCY
jgi:hypothetical protein